MELKLAQELESEDQDPLFLVFLDLRKAYNKLYQSRFLHTLEVHGKIPKLRGLLVEFWLRQEVPTCQNGFHGPQLRATRRTTQGGIVLTTLFNVAVYSVVYDCMPLTVEDESATHEGLGMSLGRCMVVFYSDEGMIGSRDP